MRCTSPKCGQMLDRSVVRQRMKEGKTFAFCNDCGEKLTLPRMAELIQLTRKVQSQVDVQRRIAEQRLRFEQVGIPRAGLRDRAEDPAARVLHQLRLTVIAEPLPRAKKPLAPLASEESVPPNHQRRAAFGEDHGVQTEEVALALVGRIAAFSSP